MHKPKNSGRKISPTTNNQKKKTAILGLGATDQIPIDIRSHATQEGEKQKNNLTFSFSVHLGLIHRTEIPLPPSVLALKTHRDGRRSRQRHCKENRKEAGKKLNSNMKFIIKPGHTATN